MGSLSTEKGAVAHPGRGDESSGWQLGLLPGGGGGAHKLFSDSECTSWPGTGLAPMPSGQGGDVEGLLGMHDLARD